VSVCKAAGLIAGSIPIKGIVYFSLSTAIALVVAVLQATTISLQPLLIRKSVFLIDKAKIVSALLSP